MLELQRNEYILEAYLEIHRFYSSLVTPLLT
jgi:hypothetical protein